MTVLRGRGHLATKINITFFVIYENLNIFHLTIFSKKNKTISSKITFFCRHYLTWLLTFHTFSEVEKYYHDRYFIWGMCGEKIGVACLFYLVKSFIWNHKCEFHIPFTPEKLQKNFSTCLSSWVYIWIEMQMTHADERWGRMYGTFVHHLALSTLHKHIVCEFSLKYRPIAFGCSPNIHRSAEFCLPRLDNTTTLNDCFIFAWHIRIPFAFRCKPGFTLN